MGEESKKYDGKGRAPEVVRLYEGGNEDTGVSECDDIHSDVDLEQWQGRDVSSTRGEDLVVAKPASETLSAGARRLQLINNSTSTAGLGAITLTGPPPTITVSRYAEILQLQQYVHILERLRVMDWTAEVVQLPDSIGSLSKLESLDIRACAALRQLPDSIGSLCRLKSLKLHDCKLLHQLPDSISSLSALEELDVSRCGALKELPDSIGSLTTLLWLCVSGCHALQRLPDSIGTMSGLATLDISGCHALQRLPSSITSLPGLVVHCASVDLQQSPGEARQPAALANPQRGTVVALNPEAHSQAELQLLRVRLLAGGYLCSIDEADLLVFEYMGLIGEQLLKDAGVDPAEVLRLRGGSGRGAPQRTGACFLALRQWQTAGGSSDGSDSRSASCITYSLIPGGRMELMQLTFTQPLQVKGGLLRRSVAAQAVVSVQLAVCSEADQTCIQLQRVRAWLQSGATSGAAAATPAPPVELVNRGGMLHDIIIEFCAGTRPAAGSTDPVWREVTTIDPATPGSCVVIEARAEGNFYRVRETRAINAGINPQVTADGRAATATVQAVSAAITMTQAEGEQPEVAAGSTLQLVSMTSLSTPLVHRPAASPATLQLTRDVTSTLVAGQKGRALLGIECGSGTTLVLDGCGPSNAAGIVVFCNVAATALLLPDVAKLLGKNRVPNSVEIARVERTAVTTDFTCGCAKLAVVQPSGAAPSSC